MSTPKMKMHLLTIDSAAPQDFMIYAQTEAQARNAFVEKFVRIRKATELDIAKHVRAGKPIMGEPDKTDPNQKPLEGV